MPRQEILAGFHIMAQKSQEPTTENGKPEIVDIWTLIFTDGTTGDQIRISFRKDTRDSLVSQLTGGIVLAGGQLPEV
jgi:CheY-specific phosphatase CheX